MSGSAGLVSVDLTFTCKPTYEDQCPCHSYISSGFTSAALNTRWTLLLPNPALDGQRGRPVFASPNQTLYLFFNGLLGGFGVWTSM